MSEVATGEAGLGAVGGEDGELRARAIIGSVERLMWDGLASHKLLLWMDIYRFLEAQLRRTSASDVLRRRVEATAHEALDQVEHEATRILTCQGLNVGCWRDKGNDHGDQLRRSSL